MDRFTITAGIGFTIYPDANFKEFIENHSETVSGLIGHEEIMSFYNDDPEGDIAGAFDDYVSDNGEYGFYGVISDIMRAETGIGFGYYKDDEEDYILYAPRFPWEYNEAEAKLKGKDELETIIRKYMDELGIEDRVEEYSL